MKSVKQHSHHDEPSVAVDNPEPVVSLSKHHCPEVVCRVFVVIRFSASLVEMFEICQQIPGCRCRPAVAGVCLGRLESVGEQFPEPHLPRVWHGCTSLWRTLEADSESVGGDAADTLSGLWFADYTRSGESDWPKLISNATSYRGEHVGDSGRR